MSPTDYSVVYYLNPTIAASNTAVGRTLDPTSIDGLVYATTPSGDQVLAAATYVYPSSVATPPTPYGSLVQWHQRTEVCGPAPRRSRARARLPSRGFPGVLPDQLSNPPRTSRWCGRSPSQADRSRSNRPIFRSSKQRRC